MDSVTLNWDPEMNLSKAAEYFKKNGPFCAIENGLKVENYASKVIDGHGNFVHLYSNEIGGNTKSTWMRIKNGNVFEKIATFIEKNLELMSQIEYSVRNVPSSITNDDLKLAVEYLRYFARLIPLANLSDRVQKHQAIVSDISRKLIYFYDDQPLWQLFYDLSHYLTLGMDVALFVTADVAAISSLIVQEFLSTGLPVEALNFFIIDKKTDFTSNMNTIFAIFESCDQDSAVDNIIKALNPFNYTAPVMQIFVQESISTSFINKLIMKVDRLDKLSAENIKKTVTTSRMITDLNSILKHAIKHGIEYIKISSSNKKQESFSPVILLGTSLYNNLWENIINKTYRAPVAGLQTFRTTKEALNLISNLPLHSLSLWCNNISVSDEVSMQVNAYYVWINSYKKISIDNAWNCTINPRGICKGGITDLCCQLFDLKYECQIVTEMANIKLYKAEIEKATKLQQQWRTMPSVKKSLVFMKIATFLDKNKNSLISRFEDVSEELIKKTISELNLTALMCGDMQNDIKFSYKNNICFEISEPVGVIITNCNLEKQSLVQLIRPIIFGNAMVCVINSNFNKELCNIMFESGLPLVCTFNEKCLLLGIWNICNEKILSMTFDGIVHLTSSKELLESKFTRQKIIWRSFGETFAN